MTQAEHAQTPLASYVSQQMRECVGRELDRRVSYPITSSDIRKWAVATYYPELPPQRFWAAPGGSPQSEAPAAPEDFNPFAWLIAEPAGPPPSLRDPEEVLGIPGPDAAVRLRGGMSVEYGVPMRGGDVITSVRRLGGYDERNGRRGRMLLTTVADTWTNQRDELVKNFEFTFIRIARAEPQSGAAQPSAREDLHPRESAAGLPSGNGVLTGLGVPPVGAEIPAFQRITGPANWNRYAAVNDEFVAIHMEDDAGRHAGATGAFGMGNLQWAYMHNMLRDWAGESGRIAAASCQFRGLNLKGQTVSTRGRVTEVRRDPGEVLVDLELWTEVQDGPTLATGTATVALPDTSRAPSEA
jgi:acyl dehydratase